jgi:murein DD-endopeptidase MepM/ murein hydrolase activator NlpD
MFDPEETPYTGHGAAACGACQASLPAKRYVYAEAGTIDVLCSTSCFRDVARAHRRLRWRRRGRTALQAAVAAIATAALVTPHGSAGVRRRAAKAAPAPRVVDPGPPPLPPGWYGPEWPPSDTSLLASLGHDAWIHPLSGPVRRMPRADSRVFGAVRPGERPAECRNGHCGVDLGGEIWGEHVHAVHDGVVDFVQRNANPDRGGEFVRIAHYDGTVFTQYFHLAAIPRGLERGVHVKSGDVIGLVGDTGVKQSAPHLHFAVSVRPFKNGPERYIDPEPLIALWPVRIPVDGGQEGLVTTLARPGLPLGSANLLAGRKRKAARLAKGKHGDVASSDAPAADEASAGDDSAPTETGGEAGPDTAGDE